MSVTDNKILPLYICYDNNANNNTAIPQNFIQCKRTIYNTVNKRRRKKSPLRINTLWGQFCRT